MADEETTGLPATVEILGGARVVVAPSMAVREDLVMQAGQASGMGLFRVAAAVLCGCTAFGPPGLTWQSVSYDVLRYGDAAYTWLRQRGLSRSDMWSTALPLIESMGAVLFPREAEVDEVAGFSAADEDGQTSPATD